MAREEGLVQHCVGVRYRVTGEGNLDTTLYSLSQTRSELLAPTVMETETDALPFRLANFRSQGMQLKFEVTEINETFLLSRIVIYTRPSATGYAQ